MLFDFYRTKWIPTEHNANSWDVVANEQERINQQELQKLGDDCGLIPDFLSKRQIVELARVAYKDGSELESLGYDEFVTWLGLVALLSMDRVPFSTLYPTALKKVECLLLKLSKCKALAWIKQAQGSHTRASSAEAFIKQCTQLQIVEVEENARLLHQKMDNASMSLMSALELSDNQEAVAQVFEFYCNYGEQDLKSDMSNSQFYKLMRDCHLIEELGLDHARIDLIFQSATHGVKKARMTLAQLFEAVQIIANIQGSSDVPAIMAPHWPSQQSHHGGSGVCEPGAVQKLLQERILPYASRLEPLPSHVELIDSTEVQAVVNRALGILKQIYEHYCKVHTLRCLFWLTVCWMHSKTHLIWMQRLTSKLWRQPT